jgi:hypothetical protein
MLIIDALQMNQAVPPLFLLTIVWLTRIDPKMLLLEICMQVTLYTKEAKGDTFNKTTTVKLEYNEHGYNEFILNPRR